MNSIVRLTAAVNKVRCANPLDCLEEIKLMLPQIPHSDILVFPAFSLCSPSCGSLAENPVLSDQCTEALDGLCDATRDMDSYVIAGLLLGGAGPVPVTAVLYRGEVIAYILAPDSPDLPDLDPAVLRVTSNAVFGCGDLRFCMLSSGLESLASRLPEIASTGCDLFIVPSYTPVYAGMFDETRRTLQVLSASLGCAVAVVNGGVGDTSSPYVYNGFIAVYECGEELVRAKAGFDSFFCTADLDADIIRAQKTVRKCPPADHHIRPGGEKRGLLRPVASNPFLPKRNTGAYLSDLFSLQTRSLAARIENIGISRLVVGVSGGLDSTAALLVCAAATDALDLPRENILAVTMPGFGTSDRTYYNALCLIEKLGATSRDISIRESVLLHFEDIGHSGKRDTAYENAQARERTQILLDLANITGGIVVGTGDLSEAAMGFTTFAGDHIANYNVNISITKSVLRAIVGYIAQNELLDGVSDVLSDILETPVSPELLPPGENGEISQVTEDILAPYELIDFFLYYFIKYKLRPSKIHFYACAAFSGKYSPGFISEKLKKFLTSFCAGQFKRACAPDSAALTGVSLSNAEFYIPSDLDSAGLLRELENAGL